MLHQHARIQTTKIDKNIIFAISVTLIFALIEFIAGHATGSLALIADAGHMISDANAIAALLVVSLFSMKLQSAENYTFGAGKLDVLAALFNIALVAVVIFHIISASFERMDESFIVQPTGIIIIGTIGLIVNFIVLKLLGELDSIGAASAKLHVLADILGSIAAIVSGIVIFFTGAIWVDVLLSFLIAGFLTYSTYRQCKKCFSIILDAVPQHIHPNDVRDDIRNATGVLSVHDIHIWRSGNSEISLTAHVDLETLDGWDATLKALNKMLLEKYDINHTTIQPETQFILNDEASFH